MGKRKTHEKFVDELHLLNPNITVLNKYFNSKTEIECKCLIHEYVFSKKAYTLLAV